MSDDLVKRLRDRDHVGTATTERNFLKSAADRIEELEAERDEALNQLDSARHSVDVLEKRVAFVEGERRKTFQALLKATTIHDDLEAKLEKAMGALEAITFECVGDSARCGSRAALEELKGCN